MPANTVTSLATSFEGMGGATALALIAFGMVFLVLGGLTLLIYAMRIVTKVAGKNEAPAAVPARPAAAPAVPAAPVQSSADDELIAVITAAIAAQTGSMVAVKSVVPVGGHLISDHVDGWLACARMEGLQGALADGWR
jgi:sodium pump decarboxylase gamma subunit